jgi:hypothetical protein
VSDRRIARRQGGGGNLGHGRQFSAITSAGSLMQISFDFDLDQILAVRPLFILDFSGPPELGRTRFEMEFSLGAVFLIGLVGGAHCAGMCGGIVGAFSPCRPHRRSSAARLPPVPLQRRTDRELCSRWAPRWIGRRGRTSARRTASCASAAVRTRELASRHPGSLCGRSRARTPISRAGWQ